MKPYNVPLRDLRLVQFVHSSIIVLNCKAMLKDLQIFDAGGLLCACDFIAKLKAFVLVQAALAVKDSQFDDN